MYEGGFVSKVSAVNTAGTTQVAAVNSAGTSQLTSINNTATNLTILSYIGVLA